MWRFKVTKDCWWDYFKGKHIFLLASPIYFYVVREGSDWQIVEWKFRNMWFQIKVLVRIFHLEMDSSALIVFFLSYLGQKRMRKEKPRSAHQIHWENSLLADTVVRPQELVFSHNTRLKYIMDGVPYRETASLSAGRRQWAKIRLIESKQGGWKGQNENGESSTNRLIVLKWATIDSQVKSIIPLF